MTDMMLPHPALAEPETAQAHLVQWFDAYHRPLARYLERLVGDAEQAADLVQDTFLRALKALDAAAPPANPQAWLWRIASNLALDSLRRRGRWQRLLRQWLPPRRALDDEAAVVQAVRACLARLSPADAEVLMLVHYAGYATAEVAALTGEAIATIRKRLYRASERFRTAYDKEIAP